MLFRLEGFFDIGLVTARAKWVFSYELNQQNNATDKNYKSNC